MTNQPSQPLRILGIEIATESRGQLLATLREWLTERAAHQVVTINPEMLVAATRSQQSRRFIQTADLRIADGAGILFVARLFGLPKPERLTGVELVDELCQLAAELGRSVYLLGGEPGVATAAAAELQRRHPTLRIAAADEGIPKLTDERFQALDPTMEEAAIAERVAAAKPGVLFVAYGHPKQEAFLAEYRDRLGASILVGVGGTFDFLANRVPRAPHLVRALWLEWLWRLIVQPWRLGRIWNATVVFLWLVARERLRHPSDQ